jgi:hypothetical protein
MQRGDASGSRSHRRESLNRPGSGRESPGLAVTARRSLLGRARRAICVGRGPPRVWSRKEQGPHELGERGDPGESCGGGVEVGRNHGVERDGADERGDPIGRSDEVEPDHREELDDRHERDESSESDDGCDRGQSCEPDDGDESDRRDERCERNRSWVPAETSDPTANGAKARRPVVRGRARRRSRRRRGLRTDPARAR